MAKAALEAMGLGKDLSGSTFQAQDEGINSRKLAHELVARAEMDLG